MIAASPPLHRSNYHPSPSRAAAAPNGFDQPLPVRRKPEFARACGEWLFERNWSHFVTLTTRFELGSERLKREFRNGYIRRLAHITQAPVTWAVFIEFRRPHHHPHIHALLGATERVPVRELERAWERGDTRARVYDPTRRAAFYVCKSVLVTPNDWDISRSLPSML